MRAAVADKPEDWLKKIRVAAHSIKGAPPRVRPSARPSVGALRLRRAVARPSLKGSKPRPPPA